MNVKYNLEKIKENAFLNKKLMKEDLNSLKNILNEKIVSFLEKELIVEELKKNIVDFLKKYNYNLIFGFFEKK